MHTEGFLVDYNAHLFKALDLDKSTLYAGPVQVVLLYDFRILFLKLDHFFISLLRLIREELRLLLEVRLNLLHALAQLLELFLSELAEAGSAARYILGFTVVIDLLLHILEKVLVRVPLNDSLLYMMVVFICSR